MSTGEGLPTGGINLLGSVSLLGGLLTRKRQRASGICLGWLQISLLTGKRKTLQLPLLLPLLRHNKYFFITTPPPLILDKSVNVWKKFYNNDDISISLMNRLTQMRKFGGRSRFLHVSLAKKQSAKQTRLYSRDSPRPIFGQILYQYVWQRALPSRYHFVYKIITSVIEVSCSNYKCRRNTIIQIQYQLMPP